jgi:natural product biosynthesis luciferase-like monooxygenase protein
MSDQASERFYPDFPNLVAALQWWSKKAPSRLAVTFLSDGETETARLTYNELDREVRSAAATIQQIADPGSHVLLCFPSALDFLITYLGCLYARVIAVPVYAPGNKRRLARLQAIAADSEAIAALTDRRTASKVREATRLLGVPLLSVDAIGSQATARWHPSEITPDDIAFLQYTSGSTAIPKGVMVAHGNLAANVRMIGDALSNHPGTRVVTWLPIYHDMGLIGTVLMPLWQGLSTVIMPPTSFIQDPMRWLRAISKYRATATAGPNFGYELCCRHANDDDFSHLDLSSLEVACNGSEQVREGTIEAFYRIFGPVGFQRSAFFPCYGLAEATLYVSGHHLGPNSGILIDKASLELGKITPTGCEAGSQKVMSCGYLREGESVAIVDPIVMRECSSGEVGEIWLAGDHITKGYWNKVDVTAATFGETLPGRGEATFLRTGDLGFVHEDQLFVTGRMKDLIVIYGRNHYPQDIEVTVEDRPAIRASSSVAIYLERDGIEGIGVVAEVVRTRLNNDDLMDIARSISNDIWAEHEVSVFQVVFVKPGSLPKTPNGKLQRAHTRDLLLRNDLAEICRWPQALKEFSRESQDLSSAEFGEPSKYTEPVPGVAANVERGSAADEAERPLEFSLFYFSSNDAEFSEGKYRLLIEGAKFADTHDFTAVWVPERHFHPFGGLYPNPSVLASALAMVTERIRLRAGSVVLPMHHPVRVAEEWAVVDNLSGGRVDLSLAAGWNPNDFVLAPDNYEQRYDLLFSGMDTIRQLWGGGTVMLPGGKGQEVPIRVYPQPRQTDLATWITCSGGRQRFVQAGEHGANVLTALLFQSVPELADKITAYRAARAQHGHDPAAGHVTLMLHTFVGRELENVRQVVRAPFIKYLESSMDLWWKDHGRLADVQPQQFEEILAHAFERYFQTSALFGTPQTCAGFLTRLRQAGVNEIACLIDFGIDFDTTMHGLQELDLLRRLQQVPSLPDWCETPDV